MAYKSSIDLAAGLRPKNSGNFPLVHARDVYVEEDARLDTTLTDMIARIKALEDGGISPSQELILDGGKLDSGMLA